MRYIYGPLKRMCRLYVLRDRVSDKAEGRHQLLERSSRIRPRSTPACLKASPFLPSSPTRPGILNPPIQLQGVGTRLEIPRPRFYQAQK